MKAVIICGGKAPSSELIDEELKDSHLLIAADKGANILYTYGIKPNVVLGDFDSINREVFEYYKNNKNIQMEKFPREKDFTDSFGALQKAIDLNVDKICFLGCTGTRIDHVLGNFGLLYQCLKMGISSYIRDDNNLIKLVDKSTFIKYRGYKYFSLQSYGSKVKDVTLKGAKYPLNNYNINIGDCLPISNEFQCKNVEIKFKSGLLLIIQSRD